MAIDIINCSEKVTAPDDALDPYKREFVCNMFTTKGGDEQKVVAAYIKHLMQGYPKDRALCKMNCDNRSDKRALRIKLFGF